MSLDDPDVKPKLSKRDRSVTCFVPTLGSRTSIDGKFLSAGGETFFVRGITYGAFRPDENGREYTHDGLIERDFTQMAALGINTVRIPHTVPPRSLLDIAARHGLRVMVGLSAEQAAGYLIDGKLRATLSIAIAPRCACAPVIRRCCVSRWETRSWPRRRAGSGVAESPAIFTGFT